MSSISSGASRSEDFMLGLVPQTPDPAPTSLIEAQAVDPAIQPRSLEQQLLVRHCQGDPQAFGELLKIFRQPIYSYLARCSIAPSQCDDLAQDIFLKIHKGACSYQPTHPLRAWIFTLVANAVRSHFRKHVVFLRFLGRVEPEQRHEPPHGETLSEVRQTADVLQRALVKLPLVARQIVLLCCIEQIDQSEAALMLGIPLNTLKTHLRRARLQLAKALRSAP